MFNLARVHRVFDVNEHPALKKMREEKAKYIEEEMEEEKRRQMEDIKLKQESWTMNAKVDSEELDPWADNDEPGAEGHDEL